MTKKPWEGRFTGKTDEAVEIFTASIGFDKRLYKYDIMGSIAHCRMLEKCKIIISADSKKIIKGLKSIEKSIEKGSFQFNDTLEDIHMNIEKKLIDKIGPIGGKLHTARSRNDQVALDIRLYLRDEVEAIQKLISDFCRVLIKLAENNLNVIMPGYTHLQRAQPVLLSHHLLAYVEMFKRDKERFQEILKRVNVLPLGSSALAGTSFPLDRNYVAKLLNFPEISENSLDAVSDRDFSVEFCSASSLLMMHLSRMSEELIIWSSSEFSFIELDDSFCTGSSIMPQKKNPDVPELVRGKTGRVYGNLVSLLTMLKSLPLAYNKDMQEDKEPLFDTIDTIKNSLIVFSRMMKTVKINKQKMLQAASEEFSTATEIADYLAKKGVPFRKAHEVTGKIVKYCIKKNKTLPRLTIKEWKSFSDKFDSNVSKAIDIKKSIDNKNIVGGTSSNQVIKRIKQLKKVF
tara:strand:+ start:10386 stop:11759 length:1374 start_codon:yes stop_codon:yes gene_type:complete